MNALSLFRDNLSWFDNYFNQSLLPTTFENVVHHAGWFPLEVKETPHEYLIFAELPGVNIGDIDLSLEGNVLTLRATRVHPEAGEGERYLYSERGFGGFERKVTLPKDIKGDATAKLLNGVLTVSVGRSEVAKPLKIAIQ